MADELSVKLAWFNRRVEQQIYKALKEIAEKGETYTRDLRGWADDTHSAEESITGYVVDSTAKKWSYDKNFNSPRWKNAQLHGGGKYNNKPSNYSPAIAQDNMANIPDENDAAIIAGFVQYLADILETNSRTGSMSFHGSYDLMKWEAGAIISRHLSRI